VFFDCYSLIIDLLQFVMHCYEAQNILHINNTYILHSKHIAKWWKIWIKITKIINFININYETATPLLLPNTATNTPVKALTGRDCQQTNSNCKQILNWATTKAFIITGPLRTTIRILTFLPTEAHTHTFSKVTLQLQTSAVNISTDRTVPSSH